MKVYPNELEAQPEFEGFSEWLQTFELYRGKQADEIFDDESRMVGKFKVRFVTHSITRCLRLYALELSTFHRRMHNYQTISFLNILGINQNI